MGRRKSAAKIVKLGRPKKLTAEQLRRAVDDYFLSLCYMEQVIENVPVILAEDPVTGAVTYQLDKYGHVMTKRVPILDGNGQPLQRLCWVSPPGEEDLCMRIGISRDTWDRYGACDDESYAEVIAHARGCIRAYLEGAAENKVGGQGALAKLERIYGLKAQVSVDVNGIEAYLRSLPNETEWGSS